MYYKRLFKGPVCTDFHSSSLCSFLSHLFLHINLAPASFCLKTPKCQSKLPLPNVRVNSHSLCYAFLPCVHLLYQAWGLHYHLLVSNPISGLDFLWLKFFSTQDFYILGCFTNTFLTIISLNKLCRCFLHKLSPHCMKF